MINTLTEGTYLHGSFFLVKVVSRRRAANDTDFLDFRLADNTGEIGAKLWNCTDTDAETFVARSVVKVRGLVKSYNGSVYIDIERIRLAEETDGVAMEDLVRTAPMNPSDMLAELQGYIDRINDEDIRAIIEHLVGLNREKLMSYPAAMKYHHDFFGGLLYHTISMLRLAEFVVGQYPVLRYDLLAAGIILHDIAKTEELDAENGIVADYTVEGKLLGHIVQGILMVENAVRELGIQGEMVTLLQHLIASHHEKKEYGSPVEPQLPEAVALCYIDLLDSRMGAIQKAVDELRPGERFTEPVKVIGNRRVYVPSQPLPG
ncbi:MAG TPA: HD domain-containing protein [Alicyclobacillus sp.]|nr:HD domain-containing protein [Alicyclobacillus sp.]